jgi:hypothetical protein
MSDGCLQVVVASSARAQDWAARLLKGSDGVVGVDCEWKPSFDGRPPRPVALLQVASGNLCVLFQLMKLRPIPGDLRRLLADRAFVKVRAPVILITPVSLEPCSASILMLAHERRSA